MFKSFQRLFWFITIVVILITVFYTPILYSNSDNISFLNITSPYEFIWPVDGYSEISSYYGMRESPTSGASTFHTGIDIPAPEGTNLFAIADGIVTFSGWALGGGYTIVYDIVQENLKTYNFKISYCHVSPLIYVSVGDSIKQGQIIGTVGPLHVYGINNNPYTDENGIPTNGASTGCHLHFIIRENEDTKDPLLYYNY